jgi:hypothetical protein
MTEQTQLQASATATKHRDRNPATATIKREQTRQRYQAIHATYQELSRPNAQGLRYRYPDIVSTIADRFYLTTDTVEQILRRTDI